MKIAATFVLLMLLYGCGQTPTKSEQVGACELEALKVYKGDQYADGSVGNFTETCMRAHGYHLEMMLPDCQKFINTPGYPAPSFDAIKLEAKCYTPDNWI